MASNNEARLLAAAAPIRSTLRDLDANLGGMGQGYFTAKLVEQARILARVVDSITAQESTGSSGSVLPD